MVTVDAVFHHADVLTLDAQRPRADAVAVLGGRVLAVGSHDELRSHLTTRQEVDLGGDTLVPGFNDAHTHLLHFGRALAELPLGSPPVASLDDIYRAVAAEAARTPPGSWIVGSGYDQNKLAEGRHPTRAELDRIAPDHLVWLKHTSAHMCVVNSPVIDRIGLDAVAVPAGGNVERDETGAPTGLFEEQAQTLVRALVYPYPVDDLVAAIDRAGERHLQHGITSCQEAGIGGGWIGSSPVEASAYQRARREGALRVRVSLMVESSVLHELEASAADVASFGIDLGIHTGFGDDWLRLGPMKLFSDGSLIGRTAAMGDDYADRPGDRGYLLEERATLHERIRRAHRSGWQVATHAVGDRAVSTVLDCYEDVLASDPRPDHRHRIEHCGVTRPEDLARIRRLGVVPVPQGRFVSEIGDGMRAALGDERAAWCYRGRSFLDEGVIVPGSSDCPVVHGAPLLGIHDLVNRTTSGGHAFTPSEAVTPLEALRCYTAGSAYASFDEQRKGTIAPGMLADFAVLDRDPTAVDPAGIAETQVIATVVDGVVAFDRGGLAAGSR